MDLPVYTDAQFHSLVMTLSSVDPILMYYYPLRQIEMGEEPVCNGCESKVYNRSVLMYSPQVFICVSCYDIFIENSIDMETRGFYFAKTGDILSSEEFQKAA